MTAKRIMLALLILLIAINLTAIELPKNLEPIAKKFFIDTTGAMVIYDLKADTYTRYNKERCAQRFVPKSTFKIPNSLFALETHALESTDTIIPWDKKRDPKQPWWEQFNWDKDHCLRTAIEYSVVWFYQEVARRIGPKKMQQLIDSIDYGNKKITGPVDRFWLDGPLKISADEQIRFLKRFYLGKLGFSPRSTRMVKEILIREKTDTYTLSAKTGGGNTIGWYVGYVERGDDVYFFALNIEGSSFGAIKNKRIDITRAVLNALGII